MAIERDRWLELGNACRVIRVASGESSRAAAERCGITHRELVDMEHGRADPTPILIPHWEAMGLPAA